MERGEGEGWRYCSGNYNHKVCNKANNCYCVSCARSFIFFHLVCGGGWGRNTKNDGAFCSLWRDVTCALWSFLRGWVSFFFFWDCDLSTSQHRYAFFSSCYIVQRLEKEKPRAPQAFVFRCIDSYVRPASVWFFLGGGAFHGPVDIIELKGEKVHRPKKTHLKTISMYH